MIEEPHGPHLARRSRRCGSLEWVAPYAEQRYESVRLRASTCHLCGPAQYELCAAGGQALIRRLQGGTVVAETPPMPVTVAWRVWEALLDGQVR